MASRRSPASRVLRNRPLNLGSLIHVQPYTTHICGQESRWDYLFSVKKREFPKINWGWELPSVRGVAQPSAHLLGSLQSLPMGRQASMSSQRITPSSGSSPSSGLTLRNEKLQGWEPLSWQLPLQKVTSATSAKVCAVSGPSSAPDGFHTIQRITASQVHTPQARGKQPFASQFPPCPHPSRLGGQSTLSTDMGDTHTPQPAGLATTSPHLPAQTFSVLFTILPLTPGLCGGFFTTFL